MFPFLLRALSLAALAAASASAGAVVSAADEATARAAIRAQLALEGGHYGEACAPCAAGDTIGKLVRLAFHDAGGGAGRHGVGGANGCIDSTTSDNAGLAPIQARLDEVSASFAAIISRADFFVLAATVAIEAATTTPDTPEGRAALAASGLQPLAAPLVLDMRFGRVSDASCPRVDAVFLPTPAATWLGLVNVFGTGGRFQMTDAEVTAIMGAHAVGRMHAANSGIEGAWTNTQSSLGNAYYLNLLHGHSQSATQPDVFVDSDEAAAVAGGPPIVMLRPDVELVIETVPTSNSADMVNAPLVRTQCVAFAAAPAFTPARRSSCPLQMKSVDDVRAFAKNVTLFHDVFRSAWRKMVEFGYVRNAAGDLVAGPMPRGSVAGFGGDVVRAHP